MVAYMINMNVCNINSYYVINALLEWLIIWDLFTKVPLYVVIHIINIDSLSMYFFII